jgi:ABC-type branched-subunit amino acid transport system ATPase component
VTVAADEEEPMLEAEEVTGFYGKVEVVSRVSLAVAAGETVALLGRNDAGKTALMRTIMGLVPPRLAGGRVRFAGADDTGRPTPSPASASATPRTIVRSSPISRWARTSSSPAD